MRSCLRVLIVAGLVAAMVFGALSLVPPRYAATAQLSAPQPVAADVEAQQLTAAAMADALRSRDLARKLMAELGRANDGELVPNDLLGIILQTGGLVHRRPGETAPDRELAGYYRSLRVAHSGGVVAIEFTSTTPELSARAANRLAELYLASTDARTEPQSPTADQVRTAEIERLTREMAEADAAVARARAVPDASLEPQRLGDLTEAVTQAQTERSDAERRARAVREMLGKGSVETIPDIHPSSELHELIAERVRVEVQKTVAERTLPAGHPRVRELQAKLSELRWRMFREATTLANTLDVEVQAAAQREAEARARLDSGRTGMGGVSDARERLESLEQDAAAKRTALEALQPTLPRTGTDAASQSAATLTPAQPSAGPVFPRKGPLALLTAVATLMLGFVFVIARQLLNGTRRMQSGNEFVDLIATARDRADVRLDGPQADGGDVRMPEVLPSEASAEPGNFAIVSSADDAARHIAGNCAGRSGYRTLLVGDGIDGAGEARDLASALATSGRRSVLVDWCPEGRGIATALGLPTQPGINDLIAGRATFDDVIMRLPGSDAHFIACGAPAVQPVLDADWVNMILDALDEAYDHITVAARMEPARTLFEAIEGRFDAGIVMSERGRQGANINAAPGVFLGFEVTEICIVQMDLAQRRATAPRRSRRSQRHAMA